MTVHTIRLFFPTTGLDQSKLQSRLDSWIANHDEFVTGADDIGVVFLHDSLPTQTAEYFELEVWFQWHEDTTALLNEIASELKKRLSWFVFVYSVSYEDESGDDTPSDELTERWEWHDGSGFPAWSDGFFPTAPTVVTP